MTETSDLVGSGQVIEALGQAWYFAPVGPSIRGAFSNLLKAKARAELKQQRKDGILSPDEYRENLAIMTDQFTVGDYNWGAPTDPGGTGSTVEKALETVAGKVQVVQLLLKPRHGDVPLEKVYELIAADPDGVAQVVKACLSVGKPDPNATTPATRNAAGATA